MVADALIITNKLISFISDGQGHSDPTLIQITNLNTSIKTKVSTFVNTKV